MLKYIRHIQKRLRKKKAYRIAKYIIYRETILKPIDHLWTFLGCFFWSFL